MACFVTLLPWSHAGRFIISVTSTLASYTLVLFTECSLYYHIFLKILYYNDMDDL